LRSRFARSPFSSTAELRAAIDETLADRAIHRRAEQLAETMRGYRGAGAVETLERLVEDSAATGRS
jgi:UDP:flavonoid glycosyltransferase YjiC (YdhE family)